MASPVSIDDAWYYKSNSHARTNLSFKLLVMLPPIRPNMKLVGASGIDLLITKLKRTILCSFPFIKNTILLVLLVQVTCQGLQLFREEKGDEKPFPAHGTSLKNVAVGGVTIVARMPERNFKI